MNQEERRIWLIEQLLKQWPEYAGTKIPTDVPGQKQLLRSLLNIRRPGAMSKEFLEVQDAYLQQELRYKGITELSDLSPVEEGLYLWQGDITTLKVDGIVNAANSQMLGCFYPCHGCIDNAIHTFAGVQLRNACEEQMDKKRQLYGPGYTEPVGQAMITKGYNLPGDYVLHTVGPRIRGDLRQEDCEALASCYRSCLELAKEKGLKSVAFCCISTGEFHFPPQEAARIAVKTVRQFKEENQSDMEVIFNVFKNEDYNIYSKLLG